MNRYIIIVAAVALGALMIWGLMKLNLSNKISSRRENRKTLKQEIVDIRKKYNIWDFDGDSKISLSIPDDHFSYAGSTGVTYSFYMRDPIGEENLGLRYLLYKGSPKWGVFLPGFSLGSPNDKDKDKPRNLVVWSGTAKTQTWLSEVTPFVPTKNQWYHIVFTVKQASNKLFVDGKLVHKWETDSGMLPSNAHGPYPLVVVAKAGGGGADIMTLRVIPKDVDKFEAMQLMMESNDDRKKLIKNNDEITTLTAELEDLTS